MQKVKGHGSKMRSFGAFLQTFTILGMQEKRNRFYLIFLCNFLLLSNFCMQFSAIFVISYQLKFFGLGALLRLPGTPNDCQNFGLKGTVNCP